MNDCFETVSDARIRWKVDTSLLSFFRRRVFPVRENWKDLPGCRVVREKFYRSIYAVDFGDGPLDRIILKDFRIQGWKNRLKHFFVPSKARNEWQKALELKRIGTPTFRPLAFGERKTGLFLDRAVLITKAIPDSETLASYWERSAKDSGAWKERKEILYRLGRIAKRFHSGGYLHRDFHAGNILLSGPEHKIFLVDLHSLWKIRWLLLSQRKANLAKLFSSLRPLLRKNEELALLESYFNSPPPLSGSFDSFVSGVAKREEKIQVRRIRSRTHRCLQKSSAFEVCRTGGFLLRYRREYDAEELQNQVKEEMKRLADKGDTGIPTSQRDKVRVITLHRDGEEEQVCLKAFPRERFRGLFSRFHRPRGLRAWIAGNGFRVRGIATAFPLAYVEKRGLFGMKQGFLFSRFLESTLGVDEFAARFGNQALSREEGWKKREYTKELAHFVREFHSHGVYQNDLSGKNILVSETGGKVDFSLIDLDSVRFWRRLTKRRRVKNLAQLNDLPPFISRADRLRFFREYCRDDSDFRTKDVLRNIAALTRMRQERRRKLLIKRRALVDRKERKG